MRLLLLLSISCILSGVRAFGETQPPPKGYTYQAVLYGSKSSGRWAIGSHLFGQFVKLDSEGHVVEVIDMSLMPGPLSEGVQHPFQLMRGILPAQNLSVAETLERTSREGKIVGMVGPLAITEELFERQKTRVAEVESGRLLYRFFDTFNRQSSMNCRTFLAGDDFRGFSTGPRGAAIVAQHYLSHGLLAASPASTALIAPETTILQCPCQEPPKIGELHVARKRLLGGGH